MYVCLCQEVTDKEIKEAVCNGACDLTQLSDTLGVASCCGACSDSACELIKETLVENKSQNNKRDKI